MTDIPKCPNCGSTAQVRLVDVHEYINNTKDHFFQREVYECGCGCAFQLKISGSIKVEIFDIKTEVLE